MLWEVISNSVIHTWPPLSCFTSASDQVYNIQHLQQNPLELHTAHGSRAGSQPLSQPGASSILFFLLFCSSFSKDKPWRCAGANGSGRGFLSQGNKKREVLGRQQSQQSSKGLCLDGVFMPRKNPDTNQGWSRLGAVGMPGKTLPCHSLWCKCSEINVVNE